MSEANMTEEMPRTMRRPALVLGGLGVLAFAALRLLPLIGTNIASGYDTSRYKAVAHLSVFSKKFLAGEAAPVFPLFLKLMQFNSTAVVVGHALIGVAAWSFLAFMAARVPQHPAICIASGAVVFTIGASLLLIEWDPVLGTDSLSISLCMAAFAAALLLRERFTTPRFILFATLALAAAADRDTNGSFFGIVAVVLLIVVLSKALARRWLAVAAVLLVCGIATTVSADVGKRWQVPLQDIITVRLLDSPARAAYLVDHGIPLSRNQIKTIRGKCVLPTPSVVCVTVTDPRFYRWIDEHGRSTYEGLLIRYPGTTLFEVLGHLDWSLGTRVQLEPEIGADTREQSPISNAIDRYVFIMNPTFLVVAAIAELVAAAALVWRGVRGPFLIAAFLIALTYPHLLLIFLGGALEVTRHALVASAQLRLGLWLGGLWMADALLRARRQRTPAEGAS